MLKVKKHRRTKHRMEQNAESKMNGKKCRTDKMSNGTKHQIDMMLKVRKAEWDIMSNGTKR
jgi:hypothetical protein